MTSFDLATQHIDHREAWKSTKQSSFEGFVHMLALTGTHWETNPKTNDVNRAPACASCGRGDFFFFFFFFASSIQSRKNTTWGLTPRGGGGGLHVSTATGTWKASTCILICKWHFFDNFPDIFYLPQMGPVRITSWYPNFNGSHFGLPPSEIHRMTGLPPKIVWTMTYSHKDAWAKQCAVRRECHAPDATGADPIPGQS